MTKASESDFRTDPTKIHNVRQLRDN